MTETVPKTGNPGNKLPQYIAALAGKLANGHFIYLLNEYFIKYLKVVFAIVKLNCQYKIKSDTMNIVINRLLAYHETVQELIVLRTLFFNKIF